MELLPKITLKAKGEVANLPTFDQAKVDLKWTSSVDLDLVAAGEYTDGQKFCVYFGNKGNLNAKPFMQLSEDAGVGAQGGDNLEELKIMNLDEVKSLSIIALNYTEARNSGSNATFSDYNGVVSLQTFKGNEANTFEVPLTSTEKGTAAIIATIEKGAMGHTLKMEDEVLAATAAASKVPAFGIMFG